MRRKLALSLVSLFVAAFLVNAYIVPVYAGARKSDKKASDKKEKKADTKSGKGIVSLDSAKGWDTYTCEGSSVKVKIVEGKKGNELELELNYDMGTGIWVGVYTAVTEDLSKAEGIKFVYKGEGGENTFEFKLEDGDGSNFGCYVESKSNPDGWTPVEIPFSDLDYFWGGDENLDLSKIKLHFAISVKDGDEGGSGKITVKEINKF